MRHLASAIVIFASSCGGSVEVVPDGAAVDSPMPDASDASPCGAQTIHGLLGDCGQMLGYGMVAGQGCQRILACSCGDVCALLYPTEADCAFAAAEATCCLDSKLHDTNGQPLQPGSMCTAFRVCGDDADADITPILPDAMCPATQAED